MAKTNTGLGGKGMDLLGGSRGLDALLGMNVQEESSNEVTPDILAGFIEMDIDRIIPNPNQPRKTFSQESIEELAQSIKSVGIIQPITVAKNGDNYEIIAGERRYRAAQHAGLTKVPILIKDLSQKQKLEISLIENIQRENLNPIEEAIAYANLIESYNITQEELAEVVGKSRAAITNFMRLLNLDPQIQKWVIDKVLTAGHARTILAVPEKTEHVKFAEHIIKNNLSVRDAEALSKKWPVAQQKSKDDGKSNLREVELEDAERNLEQKLQTKVNIIGSSYKGKIQIEYFSLEELERLLEIFNS